MALKTQRGALTRCSTGMLAMVLRVEPGVVILTRRTPLSAPWRRTASLRSPWRTGWRTDQS